MKKLTFFIFLSGFFTLFGQHQFDSPCTAKFLNSSNSNGFQLYDNIGSTYTNIEEPGCYDTAFQDVWFVTSVPLSGMIEINTIEGSLSDMFFSVYTGGDCNTDSLTLVDCSDNNSPLYFPPIGMPQLILTDRSPGEVLYIRIYDAYGPAMFGYPANPAEEGSFYLKISDPYDDLVLTLPGECDTSIIGGDECASATTICSLDNLCGSTEGFTSNYWSSLGATFAGSIENNSFFKFTPNSDTIELFTNVWGPQSEVLQLMFFTLDSCLAVPENDTTIIADFGLDTLSVFDLLVGQEYYLMIDGWAGNYLEYHINTSDIESFGFNLIGKDSICQNDTSLLFTTGIYSDSAVWSGSGLMFLDFISSDSAYFIGSTPGVYEVYVELNGVSGLCGQTHDTLIITVIDNSAGVGYTFSETPGCANFGDTISIYTPNTSFHSWTNLQNGSVSMSDSILFVNNSNQQFVLQKVLANSCVVIDTISVNNQDLLADFDVTPISGTAPLSVDITDLSSGRNRNIWVFDDGQSDTVNVATNNQQTQFSHNYTIAGTYELCLIIDSSQACSESICKSINVHCTDLMTIDEPNLDTLYYNCPINSLPIPTASHSCGIYFGDPNILFPFDTEGLTEVTWTYTDTSGNTIQQSQVLVYNGLADTIIRANEFLVSIQDTVDYQWLEYNISGYTLIPGATYQSFHPVDTGYYAVRLSYNGCVDTSNYLYHNGCEELEVRIDSLMQCYSSGTAYVEVSVNGGTAPYSYQWDDGAVSNSRSFGTCGVWNLEVNDSKGCQGDRYFYLFNVDTTQITSPIDTFYSDVMDICVPFVYQSVSIYDYFYNIQNEIVVRWIFEDGNGNSYISEVSYGVSIPASQIGYYEFILLVNCQDGADNSKSIEVFSDGSFINQELLFNDNIETELNFNLYPNPFIEDLNLDVPEIFEGGEIEIYSADYKLVYSGVIQSKSMHLRLQLRGGIYFVVVKKDSLSKRKKMIKL